MKKLSSIVMACLLVLGMTQCKKNEPTNNNTADDGNRVSITLKLDNGGQKLHPEEENGLASVVYDNGDVIYVGSDGKYVGCLTYNGTLFAGSINDEATEGQPLQFIFMGGQTIDGLTENNSTECTFNIGDQSNGLAVISCAPSNEDFSLTNLSYTTFLRNKCALVKFDLGSVSTDAPITLTGIKTETTIGFDGTVTNGAATGNIATYGTGSTRYAVVLSDQEAVTEGTISAEDYAGTFSIPTAAYTNAFLTDATITATTTNPVFMPLTFEARTAGVQVGINNTSGINLEYSTDGVNWNTYDAAVTLTNAGDMVSFRGNNTNFNQNSSVHTFTCTGNCYIYGNIMSLLHAEEYATNYTLPEYAFYRLFYNNYWVDIHPDKELVLPATQLASYCYKGMFQGSGLTKVPALPATQLASYCYQNMFTNCQSLTTVPNDLLPATQLAYACYHYMFYQCSSLTEAPALPATGLADFCCQYMFAECTNLATVHKLPATTLATSCYSYMFYNCMSLETVPDDLLPATTLANGCYNTMFRGCTNLTTAPELPASELVYLCYSNMFRGCLNLNSVTCLATSGINENQSTSNWMNSVAATGTFTKVSGVTWPTGTSGIPSGWITYKFSVSATQAVQFAPGNLQYKSGEGWRFAEHQYDYIGAWNATDWVDYFGWGTWGDGQNPLQTVKSSSSYHWSTDFQGTLNGHNDWYTLTKDEWNYLFTGRTNASSLYGHATVNGVHGIIVLPDASTLSINSTSHNWSANVIDATTWTNTYEADGAMFLPAAGQRYGTDVEDVNSYGYYWSSTTASGNNAYELLISSLIVSAASNTDNYSYGNSVRLARIVQQ